MLTQTMNNKEVIREIEKDLMQVSAYFYKRDLFKTLKKKMRKRVVQYPIQYVETFTSQHEIEWGLHAIAVDKDNLHRAIYALHRCKSGIAAYTTVPEEGGVRWQIFSAQFFDQYYKRFLQDEFDEPLQTKEIIQEFMLYNTYEFDFSSYGDQVEGVLSASLLRLQQDGSQQIMGAIEDGICMGLQDWPCSIYSTFISYEMIRKDQELLVNYLKAGLNLFKKGFCVSTFRVDNDRTFDIEKHLDEIAECLILRHMLNITLEAQDQKMTEEEAVDFIVKFTQKSKEAKALYEKTNLDVRFKPMEQILKLKK